MNLSDRILVIYEGEIVGEFDPNKDHRRGTGPVYGRCQKARGGESMSKQNKQPLLQRPPL